MGYGDDHPICSLQTEESGKTFKCGQRRGKWGSSRWSEHFNGSWLSVLLRRCLYLLLGIGWFYKGTVFCRADLTQRREGDTGETINSCSCLIPQVHPWENIYLAPRKQFYLADYGFKVLGWFFFLFFFCIWMLTFPLSPTNCFVTFIMWPCK